MELQVVSRAGGASERRIRDYQVDGTPTIGLNHGEPFGVRFHNSSDSRLGVRIVVDGIDMLTGAKATDSPHTPMAIVESHETYSVDSWPKGVRNGERLLFGIQSTHLAESWTSGDLAGIGCISALVFVDGQRSHKTLVATDGVNWLKRQRPASSRPQSLIMPERATLLQVRTTSWDLLTAKLKGLAIAVPETPGRRRRRPRCQDPQYPRFA